MPGLELAFGTEPIVGWRAWRIVPFKRHGGIVEPRLAPMVSALDVWQPRVRFDAHCRIAGMTSVMFGSHESPWLSCACGAWAVRDRATAERRIGGDRASRFCFGEVCLWGRVLEFEHGWRAQYAYPKRLILYAGTESERLRGELSVLYGIPVDVIRDPRPEPAVGSFWAVWGLANQITPYSDRVFPVPEPGPDPSQESPSNRACAGEVRCFGVTKVVAPPPQPKPTIRDALRRRR